MVALPGLEPGVVSPRARSASLVAHFLSLLVNPVGSFGIVVGLIQAALMSGQLDQFDAYDETRMDFIRWKGIYETWRRRKAAYEAQIKSRELVEAMRLQPAY